MPELVALDLPGGARFADALARVWETGDAIAPLDRRLPHQAKERQLATLGPTAIIDETGERRALSGGAGVEPGDAVVVATSGSTGDPRAVVLTHDAVAASAAASSARLGVDPRQHRWLACLPLAHIGGLSVVLRAVLTGTAVTLQDGFDAAAVSEAARRDGVTHVSLVATALGRIDPAIFVRVLLGGAAPPAELASNIVTTYGLTETGSGVVYDGRPLDTVELAIGTGRADEGALDEILVRAPMLLRTYRDGFDPRVSGPDGRGGWLPTGDAGRIGVDGLLAVDGRIADVVVTGGEKVWPVALEAVLLRHPLVSDVAVWKRPDPEWGERVVAFVVPVDPLSPPALGALRDLAAAELAPWAAPRELVIVGALPRTASGKVRRRALE
jgi:O-succinylbenzoic acid--CoA ligase